MTAGRAASSATTLLLVWAALMVLLALTVGGTLLPVSGTVRAGLAFGIALAKATLIFWFYMHGREVNGLVRLAAAAGCLWIVILLVMTGADYAKRQPISGATFEPPAGQGRAGGDPMP